MNSRFWSTVLILLVNIGVLGAKEVPPPSNTLVTDYVRILSPRELQALEQKLVAYDDSTSTQIAIVIDRSLEGDDLFDYSLRLAESWGIGRGGKDNGILIYIAFQDRKLIIQTGYGAEGFLPDALAKRIIETIIKPAFRRENYYDGLDRATDIIIQLASGEYINEGQDEIGGVPTIAIIIILLIIVIVLFSFFGDSGDDGGYWRGGEYEMDRGLPRRRGGTIIIPGGGWGGGGGLGGGGGFGGFGGGGFGGGGASGGW